MRFGPAWANLHPCETPTPLAERLRSGPKLTHTRPCGFQVWLAHLHKHRLWSTPILLLENVLGAPTSLVKVNLPEWHVQRIDMDPADVGWGLVKRCRRDWPGNDLQDLDRTPKPVRMLSACPRAQQSASSLSILDPGACDYQTDWKSIVRFLQRSFPAPP